MSLLQKTIAELRELQHEEIDLVGGGGCGPTGEPTSCPTYSVVQTPVGPQTVQDDGAGDFYSDYGTDCFHQH
jgi:hypothetical protein